MATKIFYIKGTNHKVCTSKTHDYTHAWVRKSDKRLLCRCGSRELALKAFEREYNHRYLSIHGTDVIATGIFYQSCWGSALDVQRQLDNHDHNFGQEPGRPVQNIKYYHGNKYYGRKATEKELQEARKYIQSAKNFRDAYELVELEAR